jgi:GTP-binding protein Era
MIAVIGRANTGKSTLTNKLTGEKIAIVTPKPQTTRNRIFGVFTHGSTQMILMDTPGFHKARTKLGDYMVGVVRQSVADTDLLALLVEPVDGIGTQEELLIGYIERVGTPAVLVINKIDTVAVETLLPIIERYANRHKFAAIIPISAKTGDGIPQLVEVFERYAVEGPALFPEGVATDQPDKQIVAEIIREKLLLCLQREIPFGTAVEITKFSEREDGSVIDVDAVVYCEKTSHKGMIIGKKGAMLKKIGRLAREDIERFMGAKVFLQTWVKVKEHWRDKEAVVRSLQHVNEK